MLMPKLPSVMMITKAATNNLTTLAINRASVGSIDFASATVTTLRAAQPASFRPMIRKTTAPRIWKP